MNTYLRILELNQILIINHNLISLVLTVLEELRQREPLPRHLVPIICIHELIVVHAIWRIPLHSLHCRLAAIKGDDIVDERLPGFGERKRFGWIGGVIFGWSGLARFEFLAGSGPGGGEVRFVGGGGGRHLGVCGEEAGGGGSGECWG